MFSKNHESFINYRELFQDKNIKTHATHIFFLIRLSCILKLHTFTTCNMLEYYKFDLKKCSLCLMLLDSQRNDDHHRVWYRARRGDEEENNNNWSIFTRLHDFGNWTDLKNLWFKYLLTRNVIMFSDKQTAVYFALKDRSPNHDDMETFLRSTRDPLIMILLQILRFWKSPKYFSTMIQSCGWKKIEPQIYFCQFNFCCICTCYNLVCLRKLRLMVQYVGINTKK